ncbi:MAG: hypothetical protein FWF90_09220 [Promicromonosporaceae bacterium]|nr:hypothetical protein [Promicromonosporaceae bacterium]
MDENSWTERDGLLLAEARSNLWALAQVEPAVSVADFWLVLAELDALSDPRDLPVAMWPAADDAMSLYSAARTAIGALGVGRDRAAFGLVREALDAAWALSERRAAYDRGRD